MHHILMLIFDRIHLVHSSVSLPYLSDGTVLTVHLEYIVSPALHVTKIPKQLSPDSAAPLLCGMLTLKRLFDPTC